MNYNFEKTINSIFFLLLILPLFISCCQKDNHKQKVIINQSKMEPVIVKTENKFLIIDYVIEAQFKTTHVIHRKKEWKAIVGDRVVQKRV